MDDAWPKVLIAPTGSGKTAAVTLGWVAHRLHAPQETPRRLVWCLPMRALVEQTAEAIRGWLDRLATHLNAPCALPGPNDVHVLMGGVETGVWFEQPERPAVIVGTQDMLLSRALMRGYASSRANWPMEFALLHDDTQWVFDEVQLMGAGRATSAQLEAFRVSEAERTARAGPPNGRPARSLWISATLDSAWLATVDHPEPENVVRVASVADADDRLGRLSRAKKALHRSAIAPPASAKAADLKSYIDTLADSILAAHRPAHMTLAIVNRVKRAQDLHSTLERLIKQRERSLPVLALVHSRFRPADRKREMDKVASHETQDIIVVATQAVEAGVDFSAAVLFTELAPWSSMIQRFGRANRYAELDDGADIHWIDLLGEPNDERDEKLEVDLARPYEVEELRAARERLGPLADVAPVHLPEPDSIEPSRRVIRRKDLDDLFDTDPDLTGFDVDVSPYVRDADDTDVRVFWRDLSGTVEEPPRPRAGELCAAPIGPVKDWLTKAHKGRSSDLVFVRDPQWRRTDGPAGVAPPGWRPFREPPWPGMTLLVDTRAGGYSEVIGFTGDPKTPVKETPDAESGGPREDGTPSDSGAPVQSAGMLDGDPGSTPFAGAGSTSPASDPASVSSVDEEGHDGDPRSAIGVPISLTEHLEHVAAEADHLCGALSVDAETRTAIVRAARWHDLGKAHAVFQDTMHRGLDGHEMAQDTLLAKTARSNLRHTRAWFRHELASALAFLAHEGWSRDADLVAYLIAAHHGKVRMNLRALPKEGAPQGEQAGARFARGVWEGDELPPVALGAGECWEGGRLALSIMELGWDEFTRESWTERTRDLLARFGPFRLAWMETILRLSDWRASAREREERHDTA